MGVVVKALKADCLACNAGWQCYAPFHLFFLLLRYTFSLGFCGGNGGGGGGGGDGGGGGGGESEGGGVGLGFVTRVTIDGVD